MAYFLALNYAISWESSRNWFQMCNDFYATVFLILNWFEWRNGSLRNNFRKLQNNDKCILIWFLIPLGNLLQNSLPRYYWQATLVKSTTRAEKIIILQLVELITKIHIYQPTIDSQAMRWNWNVNKNLLIYTYMMHLKSLLNTVSVRNMSLNDSFQFFRRKLQVILKEYKISVQMSQL